MDVKTKFSIGQDVVLFNGVAMEIEHDEVLAILVGIMPVKDKAMDPQKKVSENLKAGNVEIVHQYQLQHHQGLIDEKILFESEEACKKHFLEFFKK